MPDTQYNTDGWLHGIPVESGNRYRPYYGIRPTSRARIESLAPAPHMHFGRWEIAFRLAAHKVRCVPTYWMHRVRLDIRNLLAVTDIGTGWDMPSGWVEILAETEVRGEPNPYRGLEAGGERDRDRDRDRDRVLRLIKLAKMQAEHDRDAVPLPAMRDRMEELKVIVIGAGYDGSSPTTGSSA